MNGIRGQAVYAVLLAAVAANAMAGSAKSANGELVVMFRDDHRAGAAKILQLAEDVRLSLRQMTGCALKSGGLPTLIALDCPDIREWRHGVFRTMSGSAWAQIEAPVAETLDVGSFRRELCAALVRVELLRQTPPDARPGDFPAWFLDGLALAACDPLQSAAFERVWSRWSRGRLPPIRELCAAEGDAHIDDAIAGQVAGWLFDQRDARQSFAALLQSLAQGGEWTAERLFSEFLGTDDPAAADGSWDDWIVRRAQAVLDPGTTPPNAVRRFRAALQVHPADLGVYPPAAPAWELSPEELFRLPVAPWTRAAALRQAKNVHAVAIGRDPGLQSLASLYAAAFEQYAGGDAESALAALSSARQRNGELEAAAAAGRTLTTPRHPPVSGDGPDGPAPVPGHPSLRH